MRYDEKGCKDTLAIYFMQFTVVQRSRSQSIAHY
jgi:hypothetical protein